MVRKQYDKSGRKIVRATKPLSIPVLDCHKECATPRDADNCVMTKAVEDKLGETVEKVVTQKKYVYVYTPGQVTIYRLSPKLKKAVDEYDRTTVYDPVGNIVKPGVFDLDPGEYWLLPYHPEKRTFGRHDTKNPNRSGKTYNRPLPTRTSKFRQAV